MAYSNAVYGVFSQILDEIYEGQDKKREKANTWVVGIGTVITALISAATFLIQSGAEGLPTWLAPAVAILGMVGTLFGVSKTKNGVTPSLKQQIEDKIASMIDAQEGPSTRPHVPEPAPPTVQGGEADGSSAMRGTEALADELDSLAKRLASRHE